MIPQLYDISEVAKIFKTNKNMIYSLIDSGHLTALKLGRLKVTSYEIEDFLKRNNGKDFSDLQNVVDFKREVSK
ncbi:helix-turn-helix domain-containing protein [Jeotgalibacillus aurantiacus]|uniref:helix-turn-helix domain-containing protein n=1 Tax=Jeotgalibacillus aurantiacus TaxID=2763266 RepID=UPI001D0BD55F|nr:helix-turn-helix domain-containing protein [Jeotgalibacillus aurantiacus]